MLTSKNYHKLSMKYKFVESLAHSFTVSDDFAGYVNAAVDRRFIFKPVMCDKITKIVTSFKSSSPGIDDLPMQLYKDHISHLAVVITYLCNLSLEKGIFPKQLMIALITCLYKAGDPLRFDNNRAISILVAFIKIFEKIVILQL